MIEWNEYDDILKILRHHANNGDLESSGDNQ